jgi:hypothetical protein
MPPNLISLLVPALASVIVIIITVTGQWINSRNDRNLANQEVEILKKLDSNSRTARELNEVIEFRVTRWHRKIAQSRRSRWRAIALALAGYVLSVFGLTAYVFAGEFTWSMVVWFLLAALVFISALQAFFVASKERRQERKAESGEPAGGDG